MKQLQKKLTILLMALLVACAGITYAKASAMGGEGDIVHQYTVDESVCDCTREIKGLLTVTNQASGKSRVVTFAETAVSADLPSFADVEDAESLAAIEKVKAQMSEYAKEQGFDGELEFTFVAGERTAHDNREYKMKKVDGENYMYISGNYGYNASYEIKAELVGSYTVDSGDDDIKNPDDDSDDVAAPTKAPSGSKKPAAEEETGSLIWLWILLPIVLVIIVVVVLLVVTKSKKKNAK